MNQFTLVRPGPRQYVFNRLTNTVQVSIQQRILQATFTRSTVQVGGSEPIIDTDFLLAYQLAKL